jgi:cysteinyl-tRNA synthetase
MYLISGHYRQPLAFSEAARQQARANVERIKEAGRKLGPGPTAPRDPAEAEHLDSSRIAFFDALANDFNTPLALASLNEWLRVAGHLDAAGDEDLGEMLHVIGLESLLAPAEEAPAEVRELAERRELAREEKDFAAADELRDQIAALGWEVRDSSQGFELLPL